MIRWGLTALVLIGGVASTVLAQASPSPSSASPAPAEGAAYHFVDVAAAAGLVHPTWCGRRDKPHLLESGGSGLALFDADSDGDLDLYVVNGWRLDGETVTEKPGDHFYKNKGDGSFEDATTAAGLGQDGWGCGVAVGDIDGDRHPDLLVTNFGEDVLYRNAGNGTFTRVEGGPSVPGWSTGAVFFDADGDGDEDLYISGYVACTEADVLKAKPTLDWKKIKVMLGPFGLEGAEDEYFENIGQGRFEKATEKSGLKDVGKYYGFTAVAFDMEGDGDLDLHVANDSNPNYLYKNDGKGRFQDVGLWSGAALDSNGLAQAGMGLAIGDYDHDGLPDTFFTNFAEDFSTLRKNQGRGLFTDVSKDTGVGPATYAALSWGTCFGDFDLDGDQDIFIANGHIYPQANNPGTGTSYEMENILLASENGKFSDAAKLAGPGFSVKLSSRGVAAGDIDNDGDIDLVISNIDAPPTLLRNDTVRRGAWCMVDAPWARRVEVVAGGRKQYRHYSRGGSYVSVSDLRHHFGLGAVDRIEKITARGADGQEIVLTDQPVNQRIEIAPPASR